MWSRTCRVACPGSHSHLIVQTSPPLSCSLLWSGVFQRPHQEGREISGFCSILTNLDFSILNSVFSSCLKSYVMSKKIFTKCEIETKELDTFNFYWCNRFIHRFECPLLCKFCKGYIKIKNDHPIQNLSKSDSVW